MRPGALNMLCAVSLLLCLGSTGLWTRSYWRADSIALPSALPPRRADPITHFRPNALVFDSQAGCLRGMLVNARFGSLFWRRSAATACSFPYGSAAAAETWQGFRYPGTAPKGALGFAWESGLTRGYYYYPFRAVTVPYWGVTAVFTMLPMFMLGWRMRRARRAARGRCVACGYDLRATPSRCPECSNMTDAIAE